MTRFTITPQGPFSLAAAVRFFGQWEGTIGTDVAIARLQQLRGIGPFWASLIELRAVGPTDALALGEPRMRRAAAVAYGRPELEHDDDAFTALADGWRPYRTWVSVLLRRDRRLRANAPAPCGSGGSAHSSSCRAAGPAPRPTAQE